MSDRQQEFRVGVVALATTLITVLLISINTGTSFNFGSQPQRISIRVDRAPGVGPNTPIRKDGVLIGRVVATEFLPEGGVLVTANIDPGAPIYRSDKCRIRPSSLFGDAVINFAYDGSQADRPQPLESGDTITGAALPDPIEALTNLQVEVGPAIQSIGEAADGVSDITNRLKQSFGDDYTQDGGRLISEAYDALQNLSTMMSDMSTTMKHLDEIVGDPELRDAITRAATTAPDLLSDAQNTVRKANDTLNSFDGIVTSAQNNLVNLEGLTRPLGEQGEEISSEIIASVQNLNKVLADAAQFTATLSSSDGAIAKLVRDPQLYENINTVVSNANTILIRVDDLLRETRPLIRGIVNDVRVTTDKVAREPGSVLRGAMSRGPGIK